MRPKVVVQKLEEDETKKLLKELLNYFEANFPRMEDEPAYTAITLTVPASSIVTATWRIKDKWKAFIKHLYVDATAGCSYKWNLAGLDADGNEINFYKAVEVNAGGLIVLKVTNTDTIDKSLDVVVEGWARRIK
jgi:hypothetical protein